MEDVEKRVGVLEKKVAELEGTVQEQPKENYSRMSEDAFVRKSN